MKSKYNNITIILVGIIVGLASYVLLFNNKKEISSIILNKHSISILTGSFIKLEISISPDDATDKEVIWESSNPNVASVSDGIVTGISNGTAIITVKDKDNNTSDKCIVRVIKKEANVLEFEENKVELRINETQELKLIIEPIELKNENIIWTSIDENIVTINEGVITGLASGKTTVIASYGNKEAICEVKVVLPVSSIEFENDNITLGVGSSEKINPIIIPESSSDQELEWISSDENIVTVTNGEINGISEGEATITGSIDGKSADFKVKVIIPVNEIQLNKSTVKIEKGKTETITATISPSNATNKVITWSSSDPSIATVKDGQITGVNSGEVTIKATVDGKESSCRVVVTYPPLINNSKYTSGYSTITTYNSETFRYRLQSSKEKDTVLIWVENANKQLNSAFPKLGSAIAPATIISTEINQYGYNNKGLIATNSSPFWDGWGDTPCTPFIINKGKIIRDIENKTYPRVYPTIGVTKDGIIKEYHFTQDNYSKNLSVKQQMLNDGVINSFAIFGAIVTTEGKVSNSTSAIGSSNKTILCQIDNNNFVVYSGGGRLSFNNIALELRDKFNCKVAYRFDGGGSSALFYKTGTMRDATNIRVGRNLPDMMYFVD